MAIVIDRLTIGSTAVDTASTTVAITTTAAVASGGFIVLCVGWGTNLVTLSSVAGGSLTWTIDKQGVFSTAADGLAIVSAQAPTGLASGTTITATFSGSAPGGRSLGGMSFTGVATSSPVDGTPPAITTFATGTAWASGSMALSAGSVAVGCSHETSTNLTSTPTSPALESFDVNGGAGTFAATGAYRIESSAGSVTVAGAWSSSCQGCALGVAYKVASGGAGATVKQLAALGVG